jgi:hypothetical protein
VRERRSGLEGDVEGEWAGGKGREGRGWGSIKDNFY